MKKITLVLLLSSSLLFAACNNNNTGDTVDSSSRVETKTSKEKVDKDNISFKDGVLETKDYKLKIKNTEKIQSPSVDKPGLYVTYELTNKSKDTLTPFKVLYDIIFKQKTETSLVKMSAGYHSSDAFGEDTESVNLMLERQNSLNNELLPEKTVEIYEAYSLDNATDEVHMLPAIDGINDKDYDAYVINLADLTTDTSETAAISQTQEEDYEALKKRTLNSSPTDRVTWGNREWEALGVALSENGLALDDNGYIITQAQKDQLESERFKPGYGDHNANIRDARYQEAIDNGASQEDAQAYANGDSDTYSNSASAEPANLTDFVNKYGMSPCAYKTQVQGMSEEEALRTTPTGMKSSGEIQLGITKYGIQP